MKSNWEYVVEALKKEPTYRKMFHLMERYGNDTEAEIMRENGEILKRSYQEFTQKVYVACGHLQTEYAVEKGEVLALVADTSMAWGVWFWGILMAGATPILISPGMGAENRNSIMKEAGAKRYVSEKCLTDESANWIEAGKLLEPGEAGLEDWGEYIMLCTSGTTGNSRVFVYQEKTTCTQMIALNDLHKANPEFPTVEGKPCKMLAFLPFFHVFALLAVYMWYSLSGKTLVYVRDRNVKTVIGACKKHGITHLFCVPMFFNALAANIKRLAPDAAKLTQEQKQQIQAKLLGSQIRLMAAGGGHTPEDTLCTIHSIGYQILTGFGMTECGIMSAEGSLDPKQQMKGGIGKPFDLMEYKVEPAGKGELLLRGDMLYTGTMVDGKLVKRDLKEWFHTGDEVREEPEGLYISGRIKEVIINASGENIYPDLLDEKFSYLPGTTKHCILGVCKGNYEEVTLVVTKDEKTFDPEKLAKVVSGVNATLAVNEKVRHLLVSNRPLPLSAAMKIQRMTLKKAIEGGQWDYAEIDIPDYVSDENCAKEETAQDSAGQIREVVREIISDNLNVEPEQIKDTTHFVKELGGDSLTMFSAYDSLETHYNMIFSNQEIAVMTTVEKVAQIIEAKLKGVSLKVAESGESEKTKRITDFKESKQYKEHVKRNIELFEGIDNPYFLPHDSLISDTSIIRGKRVINLGSYNYLGLSGHPLTSKAAIEAVKKYGTSASGSRVLAGEKTLYQKLEQTIADWKHTEDAIVCTGGWATNLTFISSFMEDGDYIIYDELSHNSIAQGVQLSAAESKPFPHNNLKALEHLLQRIEGKYNKVLIVIEGVYSMDGDIAPVPEFVRLKKKYGCFLMVDEAHSGGVIGAHGGGVDDYFHLDPHDIDIKYGTLSKALGTCGGFIAADHSIVEYLRYSMNGFVFSAGIAPPLAAACMKAIEIIQQDNSMVEKLHRNIEYFVRRCKEEGMDTCLAGESAIVPVMVGPDSEATALSGEMMRRGVFVPPAVYPAVPKGKSRLRFNISSAHSTEQLEKAVTILTEVMKEHGYLKNDTNNVAV
ncbi:MAG: aminotransferase class I/II-fold pyridoxal phosphate-dependent enzyme [Eubacterium sp.]|nr:aminotransferase class I/II-fold pyridoxal phosphate-dependent enzyme [Eubacterium sp.]